jgi:hypothetical protein
MSFQDWISQKTGEDPAGEDDEPAWAFSHAAHARAQAERESNRTRRRYTWRARAELVRRALARGDGDRPQQ